MLCSSWLVDFFFFYLFIFDFFLFFFIFFFWGGGVRGGGGAGEGAGFETEFQSISGHLIGDMEAVHCMSHPFLLFLDRIWCV